MPVRGMGFEGSSLIFGRHCDQFRNRLYATADSPWHVDYPGLLRASLAAGTSCNWLAAVFEWPLGMDGPGLVLGQR
jgi:hypothetical protein